MSDTVPGAQSVLRAIAVLKVFSDEFPAWTVTELAAALELNRTTTYRLLTALESFDMLWRDPQTDTYRLGSALIVLGQRYLQSSELFAAGKAELAWLTAESGETAVFELLTDTGMLVLAISPGKHVLSGLQPVGTVWPLESSAAGLAIRAWLEQAHDAGAEAGHRFKQVRRQGYAVRVDQLEAGLTGIAAAIRDPGGRPIAAVSIGAPSLRLGPERISRIGLLLYTSAQRISAQLGSVARPGSQHG